MGCGEFEGDNSQNDHLCPLSGGDILSRDISDTKEPAKKRCEARFFMRKKKRQNCRGLGVTKVYSCLSRKQKADSS